MADEKKDTEEAVFTKSAAQLDLERRMDPEYVPPTALVTRTQPEDVYSPYAVEGNDTTEYRGVSPEYMTYANDTEAPLRPDEGPENEVQKLQETGIAQVRKVPDWDRTPGQAGITDVATVHAATSGEGLVHEVVDAPADFQGTATTGMPYEGQPQQTQAPVAPVKATKAAASPTAKSSTNK